MSTTEVNFSSKKLRVTPSHEVVVYSNNDNLILSSGVPSIMNSHTYLLLVLEYLTFEEYFQSITLLSKYHQRFLTSASNSKFLHRMIKCEFGENEITKDMIKDNTLFYLHKDIWKTEECEILIFSNNWTLNGMIFFAKKLSKMHNIPITNLAIDLATEKCAVKSESYFVNQYIASEFVVCGIIKENGFEHVLSLKPTMIQFIHWLQTENEWKEKHFCLWRKDFTHIWFVFYLEFEEKENEDLYKLFFDYLCIAYDDQFLNNKNIDVKIMETVGYLIMKMCRVLDLQTHLTICGKHMQLFIIHFNEDWIINVYNDWISETQVKHPTLNFQPFKIVQKQK